MCESDLNNDTVTPNSPSASPATPVEGPPSANSPESATPQTGANLIATGANLIAKGVNLIATGANLNLKDVAHSRTPTSTSAPPATLGEGSRSPTSSQGLPSQPELDSKFVRKLNPPGPFVLEDNEIEQIWWLRKGGAPCPGVGDTNRHDLHSLAEDFWKNEAAEASERLDASSSSLAVINNELYQLIGYYIVFQGVLLTASAQSSLLYCSNSWIPISLCFLSTTITYLGVGLKLKVKREFRDRRNKFNAQLNHRISQLSSLRQYRQCFYFPASTSTPLPQPSRFSTEDIVYSFFSEILIIIALLAFSAIIGWGSYAILCKPGTPCCEV